MVLIGMLLLLALLVWIQSVDPAQQPPNFQSFQFADTLGGVDYDLDSLKRIIGKNKGLPPGYEVAAAIAYSAYPQLKQVNIDMIMTDYGPPMMADVDVWTLFGFRNNRKYVIKLNDERNTNYDAILLRNLPFDAQVGILAHELGHIAYYHKLNALEFGKWGLCYLQSDEFHVTHERTTDLMPVYHGLGSQIYQYAYYVRNDTSCLEIYQRGKNFMDKYYMTEVELFEVINSD
jgi:hypothetical protein